MNIKKRIILFSAAFVALQVIDLWLTSIALQDPGISEANPLYLSSWFVPVKLGMIFLIAPMLYHVTKQSKPLGTAGICLLLGMYVMICLNNLYWVMI